MGEMKSPSIYPFSLPIIFSSLVLLLSLFTFSSGQPSFRFHYCNNNNGNYTHTRGTFNSNLKTLLSYFTSQTGDTGFYNFTAGKNSRFNQVNGIALCVGAHRSPTDCKSCISNAAQKIRTVCPNQKEGMWWDNGCMLRYSNNSIFSKMESVSMLSETSNQTSSDPDNFNKQLGTLLTQLQSKAAMGHSRRKYASGGPVKVTDFENIYGFVECTPDLERSDCNRCIDEIRNYVPTCCLNKTDATYVTPSCRVAYNRSLNFELDPIYPPSSSLFPPPELVPDERVPTTAATSGITGELIIAVAVVCSTVVLLVVIICCCCCFYRHSRKRRNKVKSSTVNLINENHSNSIETIESLQFDFSTIREATDNFSNANKLGRGGFGVVYKGTLSNGEQVAVKRLDKNSAQGEHEFKTEVLLVSQLRHRNLVKLRGFCLDKDERLLIYELLANSSLDQFLFDPIKRQNLNWRIRHDIITGIARGLLYLHEDSQLRIIHRDLKASNVLLDTEMNAKISDFGTAKLFQVDQTQGDTNRIVGTYGYMSPEYALHGFFSVKSDVYSFGVLVLEIISGRRSAGFQQDENSEDLISWVWRNWRDAMPLRIIDGSISDSNRSRTNILRCIHIGLLCVQEDPADRPTMSSILVMFSSQTFALPIPSLPAYVTRTSIH